MSIEILPAQLANQIAAGEVVERPASVIKELVENSIDAGATTIKIHIEKGGAKRIKISDNGSGISKNELSLALSRHATSKIKTLNDLEGISSLGFRGEALASISSVSRLTLTSKPVEQESAWQASTEGRDMIVGIKPAAHPNGTTIDVQDLFFNTPARRKFLRTDKTEFSHIEEVIKRIALACLEITFVLIHNDKLVRQYRAATTKAQCSKRVAQICGQKFIDHAIEVECQHDDLHFSGWLAKPSFARNQNDLCYTYVNGRVMRDKLINHAIRQAYNDLLPADTYPAFVLFLTLNHRDVDVNVHPAKHEVRFHQGRYIHDFIFSVCQQALNDEGVFFVDATVDLSHSDEHDDVASYHKNVNSDNNAYTQNLEQQGAQYSASHTNIEQPYIKPLSHVNESSSSHYVPSQYKSNKEHPTIAGKNAYYQLMSNETEVNDTSENPHALLDSLGNVLANVVLLHVLQEHFALILFKNELRLLSLTKLETNVFSNELQERWESGFISQPLLLPVKIKMDKPQLVFIESNQLLFERLGITFNIANKSFIQIRKFPALLRNKDVTSSFFKLLDTLLNRNDNNKIESVDWFLGLISLLLQETYTMDSTHILFSRVKNLQSDIIDELFLLNSRPVDLTSELNQLM